MKKAFSLMMIAAVAVLAMACTPKKTKMELLTAHEWQLDEIVFKGSDFTETPPASVTMAFDAETNQVSGSSGCNRYFGPFELEEGNEIDFGMMAGTMMMCLDHIMEFEGKYLRLLEEVDEFEVHEDRLHLKVKGDHTVLKFRPVLKAEQ